MARAISFFTFAIILFWSLLSLGVWAAISLGGDLVYGQLDWLFGGSPDFVPVAAAVFRFFQNLGLGFVVMIWAIGSLGVWMIARIVRRAVESMTVIQVRETGWADAYEDERPMKDVTPPRAARQLPRN